MYYQELEREEVFLNNTVKCLWFSLAFSFKFLIMIIVLVSQYSVLAIWGIFIILYYNNLTGEAERVYNFIIINTVLCFCQSLGLSTETYYINRSGQKIYSSTINIINITSLLLNLYGTYLYYILSDDFKHDYMSMWYYIIVVSWIIKLVFIFCIIGLVVS